MPRLITFLCKISCLLLLSGFMGARAQKQFPSPMVEHTRAHRRIPETDSMSGLQFEIHGQFDAGFTVYLPRKNVEADSLRLLIHFHGAAYVPAHAVEISSRRYCLAAVHLGSGSSVYEKAFSENGSFTDLLNSVMESLAEQTGRNRTFTGIYISSFSAGYGAVRAILRQPENLSRLDGVMLLDGLHTDYIPDEKLLAEGGRLNTAKLDPFVNLARLAIEAQKDFLITHSEIFPGTYASTTETADYILNETGLSGKAVLRWGPLGMQQLSEVRQGNFTVLGFAGNTAPDHIDHFHALFEFLEYFD